MSDKKSKYAPQKDQASAVESLKRQEHASDLLISGLSSRKVNKALQAAYNIKHAQAQVYVNRALAQFVIDNPQDRNQLRARYTEMLLDLYDKSYIQGHYKVCREITDSLAKMGLLNSETEEPKSNITLNYNLIKKED